MVDDIDRLIAEELQTDARRPVKKVAKKLGLPPSTVHRRINRLIKNNVIHMVALPNLVALGYQVWVIMGIDVKFGTAKKVADTLLKFKACYSVSETLGRFDIIIGARFKTIDELMEFINVDLVKIDGILRTETSLIAHPRLYYDFKW